MTFMNLTRVYDFIQVLNMKRKYSTKNDHFPKLILFTILYLLQEYRLNHKNYYKQELNMKIFVQATECYVHMYAKFGGLNFYVILQLISLRFDLSEFPIRQ
jgi:hypothetical protein